MGYCVVQPLFSAVSLYDLRAYWSVLLASDVSSWSKHPNLPHIPCVRWFRMGLKLSVAQIPESPGPDGNSCILLEGSKGRVVVVGL